MKLAAMGDTEILAPGDVQTEPGWVDAQMEEGQDVKTLRSLPTQRVCNFFCAGGLS